MSAARMLPLPESDCGLCFFDKGGAHEMPGSGHTEENMHAYAQAYAAQQVAECDARIKVLEEALTTISKLHPKYQGDWTLDATISDFGGNAADYAGERALMLHASTGGKARAALAATSTQPTGAVVQPVGIAIPDDVRQAAKSMQKNDYSGPLMWARKVINFVADYTHHQPSLTTMTTRNLNAPIIIGLTGPAGSGKDTEAAHNIAKAAL